MTDAPDWLGRIRFGQDGLVPVITQDHASGRVLTQAWMNRDALLETVRTGTAVYWSRSRQKLWVKGETSGHTQKVREIRADCDYDAILLSVEQAGGIACHTGRHSCFYYRLGDEGWEEVDPVLKDPKQIYPGS